MQKSDGWIWGLSVGYLGPTKVQISGKSRPNCYAREKIYSPHVILPFFRVCLSSESMFAPPQRRAVTGCLVLLITKSACWFLVIYRFPLWCRHPYKITPKHYVLENGCTNYLQATSIRGTEISDERNLPSISAKNFNQPKR